MSSIGTKPPSRPMRSTTSEAPVGCSIPLVDGLAEGAIDDGAAVGGDEVLAAGVALGAPELHAAATRPRTTRPPIARARRSSVMLAPTPPFRRLFPTLTGNLVRRPRTGATERQDDGPVVEPHRHGDDAADRGRALMPAAGRESVRTPSRLLLAAVLVLGACASETPSASPAASAPASSTAPSSTPVATASGGPIVAPSEQPSTAPAVDVPAAFLAALGDPAAFAATVEGTLTTKAGALPVTGEYQQAGRDYHLKLVVDPAKAKRPIEYTMVL